ncbi:TfpX/TfpZ family type IV pilin accessory protein [Rhodoferax antarcticus]|uniref:Fimbrial assembly protein n=1 Tax=Rhodoferax antarcticus ANT.BR TaxID=1111071 RepID=A0A1Q8YIB7_9BURK|nr:TfpX/TfpZ family type IV pilin accessory protein [Rhodoferax antarcticus]APW47924.1 pilus assembly protein [Rhodoferax antarcticus]OLP07717.1 fimbrial assembly protein [Rhodoferax antarcticus ANT.BR]
MPIPTDFFWKDRLKASGIHFGISLVIALLAAALVFGLWYPYPYREISGGRELFFIVVMVDVILGPLITFTIFNRTKPWRELRRDLAIVVLIQLGALGFGLWTVFVARPVHLVFEYDRFRVVHAVDVPAELLSRAPPDVAALPLTGPTLLSLRPFKDANEKMDATMAALGGLSLSARPDLWQPYSVAKNDIWQAAKPIADLKTRFAAQATEIDAVIAKTGRKPETLAYLPMVGRKSFWTVLLDPVTSEVLGFIPLDSFGN